MRIVNSLLRSCFGRTLVSDSVLADLVHIDDLDQIGLVRGLPLLAGNDPMRTIFDVGANVGNIASEASVEWSDATIHAFEPVSSTYRSLVARTTHLKNVKTYQFAFAAKDGEAVIHLQKHSEWNSLTPACNCARDGEDLVETISLRTISSFCDQEGLARIDVLKIDTEGFEIEVLKGAERMLNERRIHWIYAEVGFLQDDERHTYFIDLLTFLSRYGYSFAGLYDSCRHSDKRISYSNALFRVTPGLPSDTV